jgi:hypothetical protein
MKKQLLLIPAVIFISVSVYAQNFALSFSSTTFMGPPTQILSSPVTVTSSSATDLNMLVLRKTNTLAAGHDSYFCWGPTCYGPPTSLSEDTVTIPPAGEEFSFIGYLSPTLGTNGTSTVEYCFFDYNTPTDSVCVTFTYVIDSALAVTEISSDRTFSLPFPNPSGQIVMFSYDLTGYNSGIIQIHNMLGSLIKEVKLSDKKSVIVIPVKELQSGIYFASLVADGKKSITRRLVVSHR